MKKLFWNCSGRKYVNTTKNGWTDFNLTGTGTYGLSYLDDIALEWIEQAIHGLERMQPFCVKGFLEPNRMLCAVSFWNCHIIIEDDERYPLKKGEIVNEYSHTSMIEFCKCLYDDICFDVDGWAAFVDYNNEDVYSKALLLGQKLKRFKELIEEKEQYFDDRHGFL